MRTNRLRPWVAGSVVLLCVAVVAAQTAVTRLSMTESDARQHVIDALTSGHPSYSSAAVSAYNKLPPAARGQVMSGVALWVKAFVSSPAFKTAYASARDGSKPTAPEFGGTVDDEIKKQKTEQQNQIAELRRNVAALPADQRKAIEDMIKEMTATFDAQAKDPAFQKMQRTIIEAGRAEKLEKYQEEVKDWQARYPADALVLVARRLRDFQATSATVDFDAKLVSNNGRMAFVNAAYEDKSTTWKMCFRAGRDAITAVRAVADTWLKEIGPK